MRSMSWVLLALCVACATEPAVPETEQDLAAADPNAMPRDIRDFEQANGWHTMHVKWHVERQWNLLSAADRKWAQGQKFVAAALQEGQKGNGLEFMAMHRVMLETLRTKFPKSAALFTGWDAVPTDPADKANPLPNKAKTAFDADKQAALKKLTDDIGSFASDDELGLFLETSLRPTASNPGARSTDKSSGVHNYLHNRFADGGTIDLGDPGKNLQNKVFWRLHGWLDARWAAYRAKKGLKDTEPAYKAAMDKARMDMMPKMSGTKDGLGGPASPAPKSLMQQIFAND